MQLRKILGRQGGLITRQQALDGGLSSSAISRRLAGGEWRPLLPGVYRHIASPVSDTMMVHAARLWLGPNSILWGSWAAWWHGLRAEPSGPVSITVPRKQNGRSHEYVSVRRRDLHVRDVVELNSVMVTTRALTALENAQLLGGQNTFDRALQRRVSVPDLHESVTRMWHGYGVIAARAALDLAADGTVSPPERTLAAALKSAGLSQIVAGVTVWADGEPFWLDFAVESIKLAIEVDGFGPHTDPETFEKDRRKQNALTRNNWTFFRYTPWRIRNEIAHIVAELRAAVRLSA